MGKDFFQLAPILTILCTSIFGFADESTLDPKETMALRRITEYWKDGDYTTVKRQVIDFLEKNPNSGLRDQLNAMLGDLYFKEKNYIQALATYDLISSKEMQEKTFFNRMQGQFEVREFLVVIENAERFLNEQKYSKHPLEVNIRYLSAEAYFRHALSCNDMEQKIFYLKQAKPQYKILLQSKYSSKVLFPLAEIHRLLKEDAQAASLYLNLAEQYPDNKERFLFQAAILQIKDNKKKAIETFSKIHEMGGKRSKLAAFNEMILMYQSGDYEGFLNFYKSVAHSMPDQKIPLLKFYEGRCLYNLGNYSQAILSFEDFVKASKSPSKELKSSFLLLVNCARQTKDIPLLEKTMYSLKTSFPKDSEVPKVLMTHAELSRESGSFNQSLTDLKTIMTEYPDFEGMEGVLYTHAYVLSETDQFSQAREGFLSFIEKYPESQKKAGAWRHVLNCTIEEIKKSEGDAAIVAKETFIATINNIFNTEGVLSDHEKEQYYLAMLKCKCELGQYEELIPMILEFVQDDRDPELLADAHLLMAICEQKTNSDFTKFVEHGEEALHLNPSLADAHILHLDLYNAYLTLSGNDPDLQDYFQCRAAEHLYSSNTWKEKSIKMENFLWLVNHYYQKGSTGNNEDLNRGIQLYKTLLGIENGNDKLPISSETLFLEPEVIKYAELLERQGQKKEEISLLEMLVEKQEGLKDLPWKFHKRAVFDLAKAYEANNDLANALNSFRYLVESAKNSVSLISNSAQLHLAKLEYRLLKPEQKSNENSEMIAILHNLKDLQIQKKIIQEPLHLEAALQYAEIRSRLADPPKSVQTAYFFYKRMFDDFHTEKDPITQEYNRLRTAYPQKNGIFDAYMLYLDAQMLKCKAEIARNEKKDKAAAILEGEALQILNNLLQSEDYLRPYLYDRVVRAKGELEKQ